MKKHYLFLVFLVTFKIFYGQSSCDDANSYLVNAYSHVKDSYDSNNISHLKYYANRSLESFEHSKTNLTKCGCGTAYNLAYDSAELLKKVETAETYEDGRFFVKRAKELAQQSIVELDKCTVPTKSNPSVENQELSDLQDQQLKLRQQQEALKLKQEEIKLKLAEQKALESKLEKEDRINAFKTVISNNIETYNQALKVCDCKYVLIDQAPKNTEISKKSMDDITLYFLERLKALAADYVTQLNTCEANKL